MERYSVWRDKMSQFSQDDTVTQSLLQLRARCDLFTNTRLNPANQQHKKLSSFLNKLIGWKET